MKVLNEKWMLANGKEIPALALGFWQIAQEDAARVVVEGIDVGYRHIDTAIDYGNEKQIGEGLKEMKVSREEVFITSKIPARIKNYEQAKEMIEQSLTDLGVEYLDLMLIHSPKPWEELHNPATPYRYEKENLEVWKAMEEAVRAGKIRSIGVSNFNVHDLQNILEHSEIKPVVNQIPCYIGHIEEEVIAYCKEHGVLVEGYSPLATGQLIDFAEVKKIAEKNGISVPQLCLRFVYQLGVLPLPKTTHKEYMIANADLDFELSKEDMEALLHTAFTRIPGKKK